MTHQAPVPAAPAVPPGAPHQSRPSAARSRSNRRQAEQSAPLLQARRTAPTSATPPSCTPASRPSSSAGGCHPPSPRVPCRAVRPPAGPLGRCNAGPLPHANAAAAALPPRRCSKEFGGGLFALAASVVADLIHHDPLVYRTLDQAGLPQVGAAHAARRSHAAPPGGPACVCAILAHGPPRTPPALRMIGPLPPLLQAFLDSVAAGVIPSMDAVAAVPNTIMALCLNSGACAARAAVAARGRAVHAGWRPGLRPFPPLPAHDAQRPVAPRHAGGLERVRRSRALRCFVPIFSSKQYVKALQGERGAARPRASVFELRCWPRSLG